MMSSRSVRALVLILAAAVVPACGSNHGGGAAAPVSGPGVLQFIAAALAANEGDGTVTVTLSRTGGTAGAVGATWAVTGGTAAGSGGSQDYVAAPGTVNWADGDGADKTFTITINDDSTVESTETVLLTLSAPTGGATLGTVTSATLSIVDNEVAGVTIIPAGPLITTEGGGQAQFTIALNTAPTSQVRIQISSSNTNEGTVNPNQVNLNNTNPRTVTITGVDDAVIDGDIAYTIVLAPATSSDPAYTGFDAPDVAVTNTDDDPKITIADVSLVEGNLAGTTDMTFTVTLSTAHTVPVTVDFATANAAAVSGVSPGGDYASTSGTVTFAPGDVSETFTVAVNGDTADEANETFLVNLTNATNATIGDAQAVGTITNDDDPTISISSAGAVVEGTGSDTDVTFTVSLSAPSLQPVTADFALTGGAATAASVPGDVLVAPSNPSLTTVTIPAAALSATITVRIVGDASDEGPENYVVTLSNLAEATAGTLVGNGSITDDDGPTLTINDVSQSESTGGTTFVFTVSLSGASQENVAVNYATSDGTAASLLNEDYTTAGGTLNIPAGQLSGVINVLVTGDAADESSETFFVNLSNPVNATILDVQARGVIVNDDDPFITIGNATVTEGASPTTVNATFVVTLSAASVEPVTVQYSTAAGTADSGTDFTADSGTFTIAAGFTTGNLVVVVNGDDVDETSETFFVNLLNGANALIGDNQGLGTITDDDAAVAIVSLDGANPSAGAEGTPEQTFTVTLTPASQQTVTVGYSAIAGSAPAAAAGQDFVAAAGTLTFPPGTTTQTFRLTIIDDSLAEPGENIAVQISGPTNAVLGTSSQVFQITDNDTDPTVSFAAAAMTVQEPTGAALNVNIPVVLSAPSGRTVTVPFTPPVNAPGNHTTTTASPLVFAPGETVKNITVNVVNDGAGEADEPLAYVLGLPIVPDPLANATLGGTTTHTLTISEASASTVPTVSFLSSVGGGPESVTPGDLTIVLSNSTTQPVTIDYAAAGATAATPADFVLAAGSVTFAAGETSKTIPVTIVNDARDEADETFTVTIALAAGETDASLGGIPTHTYTIVDNDPVPHITISDVTQAEGNAGTTSYVFTVTLSAASDANVVVDYTTAHSGTDGTDLTLPSGTVTFVPGDTSETITVTVNGDTTEELTEFFNVDLSLTGGTAVLDDNQGVGTLSNDDVIRVTIDDVQADEGSTPLGTTTFTFTVSIDKTPLNNVTFDYVTADGTAVASGSPDFTAVGSTTVTFLGGTGTLSQSVQVTVNHDSLVESNELFYVNLFNLSPNAVFTLSQGTGVIQNDDTGPQVVSVDASHMVGPNISVGAHFTVVFSEPMNKASVEGAITLLPAPINPLKFAWNSAADTVVVIADTTAPAAAAGVAGLADIEADDLLTEDTDYDLNVAASAQNATGTNMQTAFPASFHTEIDATIPSVVSLVTQRGTGPGRSFGGDPRTSVLANGADPVVGFRIEFNEPMTTTGVTARVEGKFGLITATPVWGPPTATRHFLFLVLGTALADNQVYDVEVDNLADASGNRIPDGLEFVAVTAGSSGELTPPTITGSTPRPSQAGVAVDTAIFVSFSEPVSPNVATAATVTGAGTTLYDIRYSTQPIGILIIPRKAWPTGTLTVSIPATVTDASGNAIMATSFTFDTVAGDALAMTVDAPFSSFPPDAAVDVDENNFGGFLKFQRGAAVRSYVNLQTFGPEDVSIVELRTGFDPIPVKKYNAQAGHDGLYIEGGSNFPGPLAFNTQYRLTLKATLEGSNGTALAAPIQSTFTTRTAIGNRRPRIGDPAESTYFTVVPATPSIVDHRASLRVSVDDSDGDPVTVTLADNPNAGFTPALAASGGDFEYETAGADEPNLNVPSVVHTLTYTAMDGGGGHTVTLNDTAWIFEDAVGTLTGPLTVTNGLPIYAWSGMSSQAHAAALQVYSGSTLVFETFVNINATSLAHPADQALAPGNYTWSLQLFRFEGGAFRGEQVQGIGSAGPFNFTVPGP